MVGGTYVENRTYLLPDTLRELAGPVTGVIQLPLRLDWLITWSSTLRSRQSGT